MLFRKQVMYGAAATLTTLFGSVALSERPGEAPRSRGRGTIRFENRQTQSKVNFILNNGTTDDKPIIDSTLGGVALFDFDNDGYLDIFFTNGARIPGLVKENESFYNRLYRNNHDGTFTDVSQHAGLKGEGYSMGVAAADFDNDGWTDLYVTGVNRNVLYHNNGDGTFTDITERAGVSGRDANGKKRWSVGAAWVDYDNDGYLDLFVVNYLDWSPENSKVCGKEGKRLSCSPALYHGLPNYLFRNNHDGTFTDASAETGIAGQIGKGMSAAVADYNDDGFIDIFVANDNERNFLFRNANGRTFTEVGVEATVGYNQDGLPVSSMGVDFRDLNNDGKIDVVVSAIGDSAELLYNTTKNDNHWILIDAIGVKSNRDGIGTRIKITGESGLVQYNHVTTAGSFASSSDKRVHFGLGADKRIKEIELRWPSGTVQVLRNVKADQLLKITESDK